MAVIARKRTVSTVDRGYNDALQRRGSKHEEKIV